MALFLLAHAACAADAPGSEPEAQGDLTQLCPKPEYPLSALDSQAQGTSVVVLDVGEDGKVVGSKILGRSGRTPTHRLLDRAAQDAFEACKFAPAPGVPHRTRRVEYIWTFHPSDSPGSQGN